MPNRRQRNGNVFGHPRACERAANPTEVVAVEKIGLTALSNGEDQLPSAVCAGDIKREGRVPPRSRSSRSGLPVGGSEEVAAFDWAGEVGRKAQDRFAIAPAGCAEWIARDREERLSVAANAALRPDPTASRARREARGLARLLDGNATTKP
jgi:hypothetical protein